MNWYVERYKTMAHYGDPDGPSTRFPWLTKVKTLCGIEIAIAPWEEVDMTRKHKCLHCQRGEERASNQYDGGQKRVCCEES